MKSSQYSVILFLAIVISFQLACTDKEEIITQPPQPGILMSDYLVGSSIDSLPLEATAEAWASGNSVIGKTWRTKWTCSIAPSGAPTPVIHRSNSLSARVTGLVLGEYVFRVEFSTDYGTLYNQVKIQVVEDKAPGTQVVLSNLNWDIDALEITGGGEYYAYAFLYQRPDLVFFRGWNRMPKVEYKDPITKQWVLVPQSSSKSRRTWVGFVGATFNLPDKSMEILLVSEVNSDWRNYYGQKIPVRLTY